MTYLQTSTATVVTTKVRWPSLKGAQEAAAATGITEQRLLELADAQFAPHWRIDGGPPLFAVVELKEWAGRELLHRYRGKALPTNLIVVFEGGHLADLDNPAPKAIQDIEGLRDATELLQLRSGIYFLCELGQVVYVGQSVNPGARVSNHHRDGKDFDRIFFLPWPRFDLTRIETAFIKVLRPPLNGVRTLSEPSTDERELVASLRPPVGLPRPEPPPEEQIAAA